MALGRFESASGRGTPSFLRKSVITGGLFLILRKSIIPGILFLPSRKSIILTVFSLTHRFLALRRPSAGELISLSLLDASDNANPRALSILSHR